MIVISGSEWHSKFIYASAILLSGAIAAYGLVWSAIVGAWLLLDQRILVFGLDINATLGALPGWLIPLIFIGAMMAGALFYLIARKSLFCLPCLGLVILTHLIGWIVLTQNPYYSGVLGYILIVIESALVYLIVSLYRSGTLSWRAPILPGIR
jgi:hypothetical protein